MILKRRHILWSLLALSILSSAACAHGKGKFGGLEDAIATNPKSVQSLSGASLKPLKSEDLLPLEVPGFALAIPRDSFHVIILTYRGEQTLVTLRDLKTNHEVPVGKINGAIHASQISPDAKWLSYQKDTNGDEDFDLYLLSLKDGHIVHLTQVPHAREEGGVWSPDSKTIAYRCNAENAQYFQVCIVDVATKKSYQLTHDKIGKDFPPLGSYCWLGNNQLYAAATPDWQRGELRLYQLDRPDHYRVIHPELGLITPVAMAPDFRYLAVNILQWNGAPSIALLNTKTDELKLVTDDSPSEWSYNFSPDSKNFAFIKFENGLDQLNVVKISSDGSISRAHKTGVSGSRMRYEFIPGTDQLVVSGNSSVSPGFIIDVNLKTEDKTVLADTQPSLDKSLVEPQIVFYKTFDQLKIPALLFVPPGLKRDGSNPAVIYIHGGPDGYTADSYNSDIATLVNHGFIVLAPNERGSIGYGTDYEELNNLDLGGGDIKDINYGREFLIQTGYVAANRVGVIGGSYGGFMTLAAITQDPTLWKAAVESYGISDWVEVMKDGRPDFIEFFLKKLSSDENVWREHSPMTRVSAIQTPLWIFQGEKDVRVPLKQSQIVYDYLKAHGREVHLTVYPDEGHGFVQRGHLLDYMTKLTDFFTEKLR